MTIAILTWAIVASICAMWLWGNLISETAWRDRQRRKLMRQRDCLYVYYAERQEIKLNGLRRVSEEGELHNVIEEIKHECHFPNPS